MSTCQVTRDLDTFKKGLSLHGAKARRCLLTTGHLLEVLQEVKASEMRIKECCQLQKIFLANDEVLAKGSAWQLRVPDSDADTGFAAGPSAIDMSLSDRFGVPVPGGQLGLPHEGCSLLVEGIIQSQSPPRSH
jgi:hypothetical protein